MKVDTAEICQINYANRTINYHSSLHPLLERKHPPHPAFRVRRALPTPYTLTTERAGGETLTFLLLIFCIKLKSTDDSLGAHARACVERERSVYSKRELNPSPPAAGATSTPKFLILEQNPETLGQPIRKYDHTP